MYFIDLEDFRRAAKVSWDRRIMNLVHLDRSIGRFLCRAARLDFLYSYLGHKPDRASARKMVAEVKAARESIDRRKRRGAPARKARRGAARRRNPLVPFSIRIREYDHHTEQVHAAGGSWVRDVMLGLNDGLVASFAVTSGVAAAFVTGNAAMMAGLSEMLGGAVAMGLAAFISARSQIEFYQSEIERERDEIRRWPDREREEISSIYRNKGFTGPLLDQIVAHITSDPERWSNVMMREELGFNEESFDSPIRSAFAVGLSYLARRGSTGLGVHFFRAGPRADRVGHLDCRSAVRSRRAENDHHQPFVVAQRTRKHVGRSSGRGRDLRRRTHVRRALNHAARVMLQSNISSPSAFTA